VALALRIAGQVDITTLRRAAEAVVNQQEILQVRFVTTVHGVRQLLSPRHRIRVRVHHFDYLARGQRASALRMATRTAARRGLDLKAGKTVALDLLRLSPTAHVLVLVQHHLVTDGWS